MSDCTDVCEVVIDVLIGLGYDIKTGEGNEDHEDILAAFSKYSQSYADLLAACKAAQLMLLQTDWNGDDRMNIVQDAIGKTK